MRRAIQLACFCMALCAGGPLFGTTLDAGGDGSIPAAEIAGYRPAETGVWRSRTQQIFDSTRKTLVRRQYTVWDPEPSRNRDFVWIPDDPSDDREGPVNGPGRLIWRLNGKPAYDPDSIVAEFRGVMKDGRANGRGTYVDHSGLAYDGDWTNGAMEGHGRLKLPNADEYVGPLRAGRANGTGRYVDVTGEIFEGPFLDGLRHGRGTTRLPSGQSYRSSWAAGEETEGSRAVRIAQVGGQRVPGGSDDARVAIEIDTTRPGSVTYTATNVGPVLSIQPEADLLDIWKGGSEVQFEGDGGKLTVWGRSGLALPLRMGVQNRSTRALQVESLHLDVQSSAADLQPAVQMKVGKVNACGHREYAPVLVLQNLGWSPAEDATLRFAFTSPDATTPPATLNLSRNLGRIDKTLTVDLEPDLRAAGVNTATLKSRANGTLPCRAKDEKSCVRELRSSGLFGSLVASVSDEAAIAAVGTLEYGWTDRAGQKKRHTSKFNATLGLGNLLNRPASACAEDAAPEAPVQKPLGLRLDQAGYRVTVPLQPRPLPAGRTLWFRLPIEAPQSSQHEFRAVARMADGSEITSRPIRLQYYVPRWFPGE